MGVGVEGVMVRTNIKPHSSEVTIITRPFQELVPSVSPSSYLGTQSAASVMDPVVLAGSEPGVRSGISLFDTFNSLQVLSGAQSHIPKLPHQKSVIIPSPARC